MSIPTWAGVAPFCGAKTFAASVNNVSTSHATRKSTARSLAGVPMALIAPSPPSVVAEPPRHTMIFFAPALSAVSINSPTPCVVALSASFFVGPPARVRPDARAISMTATPRCSRHAASTGWPNGPVTTVVRLGPPKTSRVPSPPSAMGISVQSILSAQQACPIAAQI